jgi:hypothetical protein
MRTDIPLKRLTALCGSDLLPLFGAPYATLLRVDTLELPASADRLDCLLTVRSPQGQEYLHVLEWQGYRDPTVLWRLAGYLSWIGQRTPTVPVVGTLIYLAPQYDVGDKLEQIINGAIVQSWPLQCVRLWEHDAAAALASGALGQIVLSPLMHNANQRIVEEAAQAVLRQAPLLQQADLLVILGVFAEPFVAADRFVRLVGKERLMASDLVSFLMEEQVAEREMRYTSELQRTLQAAIAARFPQAPLGLALAIQQITSPDQLHRLIVEVVQTPDLDTIVQQVNAAANAS